MSSKTPINKQLLSAAERGNTKDIMETLNLGADIEYKKSGVLRTPLLICCQNGDFENSRILIERGANINAMDNDRQTPLFFAIASSNVDLIRFLIGRPEIDMNKVNGRMHTPLSLLINSSAIHFKDQCRLVPMFLERGSCLILKYAINGRNVLILNDNANVANMRFSENAFMIAVEKFIGDHKYKKIVKQMIMYCDKENMKIAAEFQHNGTNSTNALLKILLDEGSQNTSKSIRKQFQLTDMLLETGADINYRFQEYDQLSRTHKEIPLFVKLCGNPKTSLSAIEYVVNYTDLKTTDADIEKLEHVKGNVCRIFQMKHELAKHNVNVPFEANQDVIEMMFGRIANPGSEGTVSSSSESSKSESSKSEGSSKGKSGKSSKSSKSSKGSKEGGKRTRKKI